MGPGLHCYIYHKTQMKYASYINLKLLKHFDQDEFNKTATIDHKGVAQFVYELLQQKLKELTVAAV